MVLAEQPDGTLVLVTVPPDGHSTSISGLAAGSQNPQLDGSGDTLHWCSSPLGTAGFLYNYAPSGSSTIWVFSQDASSKTWTYDKSIDITRGIRFGCISDDGSLLISLGEDGPTIHTVAAGESRLVSSAIGHVSGCSASGTTYVLTQNWRSANEITTRYEWIDATTGELLEAGSSRDEALLALSPDGSTLIASCNGSVVTSNRNGEILRYRGLEGRIIRSGELHLLNAHGSITVVVTNV